MSNYFFNQPPVQRYENDEVFIGGVRTTTINDAMYRYINFDTAHGSYLLSPEPLTTEEKNKGVKPADMLFQDIDGERYLVVLNDDVQAGDNTCLSFHELAAFQSNRGKSVKELYPDKMTYSEMQAMKGIDSRSIQSKFKDCLNNFDFENDTEIRYFMVPGITNDLEHFPDGSYYEHVISTNKDLGLRAAMLTKDAFQEMHIYGNFVDMDYRNVDHDALIINDKLGTKMSDMTSYRVFDKGDYRLDHFKNCFTKDEFLQIVDDRSKGITRDLEDYCEEFREIRRPSANTVYQNVLKERDNPKFEQMKRMVESRNSEEVHAQADKSDALPSDVLK